MRHEHDAYMTPRPVCDALLEKLGLHVDKVLEPCCGTGNWVRAYKAYCPSADIFSADIQDKYVCHESVAHFTGDVLTLSGLSPNFDLVLGNPPYKHAEAFVEKGMACLRPSGHLAFLLRIGFLASRKRYPFFQRWKPSRIISLSGRPSFTGQGSDRYDYAFIVWPRTRPSLTVWESIETPRKPKLR